MLGYSHRRPQSKGKGVPMPTLKERSRHGSKAAGTALAIAKLRKQSTDHGTAPKVKAGRKQSKTIQDRSELKPSSNKKQSVAESAPDRMASKAAADTEVLVAKSRAKEDISHAMKGFGRSTIAREGTGAVTDRSGYLRESTAPTKKEGFQSEPTEGTTPGNKPAYRESTAVQKWPSIGALPAFILVVGVGAILVAIVLGAYFALRRRHEDDEALCLTPECKAAAAYLHGLLKRGYHPCSDFYSRVCGSLIDHHTGFHESRVMAALKVMNASMFVLGETLEPEDIRLGKHILKPLYRKCFRYMSADTDLRKDFTQAEQVISIRELVNATSFAGIVRYLVRTALRIGSFTLFDVRFVRMGKRNLLQLRRGYSLRGKLGTPAETKDVNFRITKLLNVWLGREDVNTETATLLRLDYEVTKLFRKSAPQVLKTLQDVTSGMMNLTSAEWTAAVNDAHAEQDLKLKPSDTVVDTDMASVHEASSFLVGEGVQVTAFYLATNLAADLMFLVHTKLDTSANRLQQSGFCMFLVRKCLVLTWPVLAAQILLRGTSSVQVLHSLYSGLKVATKESSVLTWIREESFIHADNVIDNVTLSVVTAALPVGIRVNYTGPTPPIIDDDHGFIQTFVRARRHHCDVALRSPPSIEELAIFDVEETARVSFVDVMSSVLVPTVPQLEPYLYEHGVPDQYNYGTLGSLLAAGLVEALELSVEGDTSGSWDKVTLTRRNKTLDCLIGRHHRQGFGRKVAGSPKRMRSTLMALSAGLRLAYAAMETSFRQRVIDDQSIQKLWPAAQDAFFVRYCLLWCSVSDKPNPITAKEMCMLPLYNMKEFGELYKCRANTTYSAGAFCDV